MVGSECFIVIVFNFFRFKDFVELFEVFLKKRKKGLTIETSYAIIALADRKTGQQKGRIRWCGSMAEQLICNQQVGGSTPFTSSSIKLDLNIVQLYVLLCVVLYKT